MIVTERDKLCAKTLLELLNKVKLELHGSEIVIAGRIFEWSAELLKRIENDLKPQPEIKSQDPEVSLVEKSTTKKQSKKGK